MAQLAFEFNGIDITGTSGTTITFPSITDTVIGRTTTDTLTNKTISGSSNTLTNIGNSALTNSTISGVSLGSNLNALTIGTGLSGTSYNGSSAVTISIDSTVTTLSGSQTLTNKTLGSGTTLSANLAAGTNKITGLGDPTSAQDAATKAYVDSVAQGLDVKPSVRAATTGSGTLATSFANAQVIDGVTLVTGDRILIKNQATTSENGVYIVNASGAPTRATDMDTGTEFPGAFVFVEEGTVNADTGWVCTNNAPVTVGSTSITFSQFSGVGTYTASTGLTLTGSVFSIDSTVATTSGSQTLTNKTISSGVLTGTLTAGGGAGSTGQYLESTGTGVRWTTVSGYSAPTLGTTSIGSGATVTNINGLTINSTTIPSSATLLTSGGALGTPNSGTLTNATGLPISTGVSGLGSGIATFLATPSSANLISAVTDETGSGALVFGTTPTLSQPVINVPRWGYTGTSVSVGTLTLTATSSHIQLFVGTGNLTLTMPVTSTLAAGQSWIIDNNAAGTITVNSSGGNLITTVNANHSYYITCIATSGTTAGDWMAEWNGSSSITGTGANVLATNPVIIEPSLQIKNGTASTSNYSTGDIAANPANGIVTFTAGGAVRTMVDTSIPQTLTNKTLSGATLTGTLTAGGGVGTSGQVLQSTGTGVQWATAGGGSAASPTVRGTVFAFADTNDSVGFGQNVMNTSYTGARSTAIGAYAGASLANSQQIGVAADIVAVGWSAARSMAGGNNSIFIGSSAGRYQSYNSDTVAIGKSAMENSSTGGQIAIGPYALQGGQQTGGVYGGYNVAVGYGAMNQSNGWNAQENVAIGFYAMYSATGYNNVSVGSNAGYALTNGNNNTLIGYYAGGSLQATWLTSGSNNILIGNSATPTSSTVSNQITLGNSSISALRCQVTSITSLSDERDKKDISDLPIGLDFVNKLRPVKFTWNMRQPEQLQTDPEGNPIPFGKVDIPDSGFIAQELVAVEDEENVAEWLQLTFRDNPDRLEASPGRLIPVLVKAIQELSQKVSDLESKI